MEVTIFCRPVYSWVNQQSDVLIAIDKIADLVSDMTNPIDGKYREWSTNKK